MQKGQQCLFAKLAISLNTLLYNVDCEVAHAFNRRLIKTVECPFFAQWNSWKETIFFKTKTHLEAWGAVHLIQMSRYPCAVLYSLFSLICNVTTWHWSSQCCFNLSECVQSCPFSLPYSVAVPTPTAKVTAPVVYSVSLCAEKIKESILATTPKGFFLAKKEKWISFSAVERQQWEIAFILVFLHNCHLSDIYMAYCIGHSPILSIKLCSKKALEDRKPYSFSYRQT